MGIFLRRLIFGLLVSVCAGAVVLAGLYALGRSQSLRRWAAAELSARLSSADRRVEIEGIGVNLPLTLGIRRLRIAERDALVVEATGVQAAIAPTRLLRRMLVLRELRAERVRVVTAQRKGDEGNAEERDGGGLAAEWALLVEHLSVGSLRWASGEPSAPAESLDWSVPVTVLGRAHVDASTVAAEFELAAHCGEQTALLGGSGACRSLTLEAKLEGALAEPSLQTDVRWDGGRWGDLGFERARGEVKARLQGKSAFPVEVSLDVVGMEGRGRLAALRGSSLRAEATLRRSGAQLAADLQMPAGKQQKPPAHLEASLSYTNTEWNIERALITAASARIEASASIDRASQRPLGKLTAEIPDLSLLEAWSGVPCSGSLRLELRTLATDPASAAALEISIAASELNLGGGRLTAARVQAGARLDRLTRSARGHATLRADHLSYAGTALTALSASAEGSGGVWDFRGLLEETPGDALEAAGKWRLPPRQGWSLESRFKGPARLLRLARPGLSIEGTLDGRVTVTRGVEGLSAEAKLDCRGLRVPGSGLAELTASDCGLSGGWRGQQAQLSGWLRSGIDAGSRLEFELTARGLTQADDAPVLDGRVSGRLQLGLLNALDLPGESVVGGGLDLQLAIAGAASQPAISGQARLAGGSYESPVFGIVLREAEATVTGSGGEFVLSRLVARDIHGSVLSGSGRLILAANRPASYSVTFVAEEPVQLVALDELQAFARAHVSLTGEGSHARLAGRFDAERIELTLPEGPSTKVTELEIVGETPTPTAVPEDGKENAAESRLDLDLIFDAPARVYVRGSGLDSEWKGTLRLHNQRGATELNGAMQLVRGSFELLNLRFQATRGSLVFDGGAKIDPAVDVIAETRKHDVTGRLAVSGRVSHPVIELGSVPPLPPDEVLARLLFGKSPGNLSAVESLQLGSAVARLSGRSSGPNPMEWLRRTLALDRLGLAGSGGGAAGPGISVGKYVSDRIYLSVNQGLDPASGKATVDVELTPSLRLQSEVGRDAQGRIGLNWRWDY